MTQFKVGDEVEIIKQYDRILPGSIGIVECESNRYRELTLRITHGIWKDGRSDAHICNSFFNEPVGYYVSPQSVELRADKKELVLRKIRYLNERFDSRLRSNNIPKGEPVQSTEQSSIISNQNWGTPPALDLSIIRGVDIRRYTIDTNGVYRWVQSEVRSSMATPRDERDRIYGPSF